VAHGSDGILVTSCRRDGFQCALLCVRKKGFFSVFCLRFRVRFSGGSRSILLSRLLSRQACLASVWDRLRSTMLVCLRVVPESFGSEAFFRVL